MRNRTPPRGHLNRRMREASVIYDCTVLNASTMFFYGVHEATDWVEEHTPQHLSDCKEALALLDANERDLTLHWSGYDKDVSNINRTLMGRMFHNKTVADYRERYFTTISMRAHDNHWGNPYLVGYAALIYIHGRMAKCTICEAADMFRGEMKLQRYGTALVNEIMQDLDHERLVRELMEPVARIIARLLLKTGMSYETFMEYVAHTDKTCGSYLDAFSKMRLKDIQRDTVDMVLNREKNTKH
ncbi:MAG: hypothetical protein HUK08_08070 [Bacteroidaceae bacterium]|nr:hypothetical protein [Bacteroidaceae bacterium]